MGKDLNGKIRMQQEHALVEHLLVLRNMIDIDKIIDEVRFEYKKVEPKNLIQMKELNHYSYLNKFSPKFSWLNKKYKKKLLDNCIGIKTDFTKEEVFDILKRRRVQTNEFTVYHFTNKFWEQVLKKYSKKIVAIHSSSIVLIEDSKIDIKPFSIIQNDKMDFFYVHNLSKWILINNGVIEYKGLNVADVKIAETIIKEELRKYNIKKFINEN